MKKITRKQKLCIKKRLFFMKKSIRIIAMLMAVMMMTIITVENVSAETFSWNSVKSPGSTDAGTDIIKMPLYKGQITFTVTNLNGNCTCLIARTDSTKENYYYVNNSLKSVMLTEVGGEAVFTMKFTTSGLKQEYMYLNCYVVQDASIGELVYGSGTLYY